MTRSRNTAMTESLAYTLQAYGSASLASEFARRPFCVELPTNEYVETGAGLVRCEILISLLFMNRTHARHTTSHMHVAAFNQRLVIMIVIMMMVTIEKVE